MVNGIIANYWPNGYEERFEGQDLNVLKKAIGILPEGDCLEIGCGNGYWTNELLVPKFKRVVCVDVIEKVEHFKGEYYKILDHDLSMFKNFDVVYSYGVFPHLELQIQEKYLRQIRKVLTGKALISFANFPRHDGLRHIEAEKDGWFYNNTEITYEMCKRCGFEFLDFDTSYRDTIAILW